MSDINVFSPEATTTGITLLGGGVILKLLEKFLLSRSVSDDHTELRKELRLELDIVRQEVSSLREEVDEWREKYYHQVETTTELLFEVNVLKVRLGKYETLPENET